MTPTSVELQIVVAVVALAAIVLTAVAWGRSGAGGWARLGLAARRVGLLLLCAVTAAATVGVAVNREVRQYPTWGELLGRGAAPNPSGGAKIVQSGESQIVPFPVAAGKAGISLPAWAYLPGGYATTKQRYPAVVALAGFPGSPQTWFDAVGVKKYLDAEITAKRMAPTVVIFPVQHPSPDRDSECVDAVGGAQFDTYLSLDVPAAAAQQFRLRTDRAGWGLIGFSTGGFCVVNLLLRHPDRFAAAASIAPNLTPIVDGTTGDLYRGDEKVKRENNPLWRIANLPPPPVSVYLANASDDTKPLRESTEFASAAKAPMRVTQRTGPPLGHTFALWQTFTAPSFDWLSAQLATPLPE